MSNESITTEAASSQQDMEVKPGGLFLAGLLQGIHRMFDWLSGLLYMTDKEQEEAGIDLSDQG